MPVKGTAYVELDVIYLFWHVNFAYIISEVLALLGTHVEYVGILYKEPTRCNFGSIVY